MLLLFNASVSLVIGTFIALTSTHWLTAWIGLEISTIAIVPLLTNKHHPRITEAATKYFLAQALASCTLIAGCTSAAIIEGHWVLQNVSTPIPTAIITLALAIKLGMAPLHAWIPEVIQGVDLNKTLILATWQKLAPFGLFVQITHSSPLLIISLAIISMLVGGWGGLNQTQLRKILIYSSIAHMGWMTVVIQFSPTLAFITFVTYCLISAAAILVLQINSILTINLLATSWTKTPAFLVLIPLILLSLAGIPPFSGFLPKWMIVKELATQGYLTLAGLAVMTALLTLFFYVRLILSVVIGSSPSPTLHSCPWRFDPKYWPLPRSLTVVTALILLPVASLIIAVFC